MGTCFSAGDVSSGLLIFSAMQQEDDLKALESIVQFARGLGVFFLVLHVYWYCYEWLSSCGLTYGYADRLLLDIQRTTLLFTSPVVTKLCAFLFLALGCYGTKSVRNGRVDRRHIVTAACFGFPLFFLNGFLLSLPAGIGFRGWSYTLTLGAGYLSLLAAGAVSYTHLDVYKRQAQDAPDADKTLYYNVSVRQPYTDEYTLHDGHDLFFVFYVNTNDFQPLLAQDYIMRKKVARGTTVAWYGTVGNIVNLRTVQVGYDAAAGRALLDLGTDMTYVLSQSTKYIRPLRCV